jgi:hypothetical protein
LLHFRDKDLQYDMRTRDLRWKCRETRRGKFRRISRSAWRSTARQPPPINAAQLGVEHHNERTNTLTAARPVGSVPLPFLRVSATQMRRHRATPWPATDKPQPSPSVLDRHSGRRSPQSPSAMLRPTPRPTRTSRTRCSRSTCSSGRRSAQPQRQHSPPKTERPPGSRRPHSAMAPRFPSPRRCSTPSA